LFAITIIVTVSNLVLHPDRNISDGFSVIMVAVETVLVNVVRKVFLERGFVLGRDAGRGNAVAWSRNTLARGRVDITCGDMLTVMT